LDDSVVASNEHSNKGTTNAMQSYTKASLDVASVNFTDPLVGDRLRKLLPTLATWSLSFDAL
jgi:hypothetical protein